MSQISEISIEVECSNIENKPVVPNSIFTVSTKMLLDAGVQRLLYLYYHQAVLIHVAKGGSQKRFNPAAK